MKKYLKSFSSTSGVYVPQTICFPLIITSKINVTFIFSQQNYGLLAAHREQ